MPQKHNKATTTPEIRVYIHESDLPTALLAGLLKSLNRLSVNGAKVLILRMFHMPKQLTTTLSLEQLYTDLQHSLDERLTIKSSCAGERVV
jgi:hypothetical protein